MQNKNLKALAKRPSAMPRSGIRVLMDMAAKIENVIHLEIGEPSFLTPEYIVEAGFEAARHGFTKYTPNQGLPSLREAISGKLKRVNGLDVPEKCITITVGGVEGLSSALFALADPSDEVLVPNPGWSNYFSQVAITGAKAVAYPLYAENDFVPKVKDIEPLITKRTKVLMINSPSNPCGSVFPQEVVESLIKLAQKHGIYILSDEVYDEMVFDGQHYSFASAEDDSNVVSIFSFSKTYAMTGWRVGYMVASEKVTKLMTKLQEPLVSCTSAISQKAAEAALAGPQDSVAEQREAYKSRRDLVVKLLSDAGMLVTIPKGAFYVMADISASKMDSYAFAERLLTESKVALAPGATFGDNAANLVRISLATKEDDLIEGVKRICEFCHKNKKLV